MNPNRKTPNEEEAEATAIKALAFLSGDAELLGRFLALTGLDPSDIRAMIADPSFLVATLEFLLTDDAILLAFASNNALAPEEVLAAKARLDPMSRADTGAL